MNLNINEWKIFLVDKLFDQIYKSVSYDDAELQNVCFFDKNSLPYITRTEYNNGCKSFVRKTSSLAIEKGNAIIIGDTTSTCFYQYSDFVTGEHIVVLRNNAWMNKETGLFIQTILKKEKFRYSYGRAFTQEKIKETIIKLPILMNIDGVPQLDANKLYSEEGYTPDFEFMVKYIRNLNNKPISTVSKEVANIEIDAQWKEFSINVVFDMLNGKCITKEEIEENPGDFNAIQSGEENNGIMGKIDRDYCVGMGYTLTDAPCLTVARSGSAGYVSYQQYGCVVGDSAKILLLKNKGKRNPYVYLFLKTILMANKYKYTYGRKVTETKYLNEKIKLPSIIVNDEPVPDWDYMEKYIKSLPYGDRILGGAQSQDTEQKQR